MTGQTKQIVTAEKAQRLANQAVSEKSGAAMPLWRAAPDLARTVVVQAEQIAAVLALHPAYSHWCSDSPNSQPRIFGKSTEAGSLCPVRRALGVTDA